MAKQCCKNCNGEIIADHLYGEYVHVAGNRYYCDKGGDKHAEPSGKGK
jgi:hypothetical protein